MVEFLSGWQQLAGSGDADDDSWIIDPWIAERLDDLIAAEREMTARIAGNTLSHWDLRADNIVLTADEVWFVDWAHARNAAGWLDAALLTADIVASGADCGDGGGIDVARLIEQHPVFTGADPDTVLAVLASLAATLHRFSRRPSTPGLPTIRGWQGRTAEALLRYVRRRFAESGGRDDLAGVERR
jgi:thiamine kinase-like enzyme